MSESTDTATDALFRANKRRKVYRKRNIDDQADNDTNDVQEPNSPVQDQMQTVRRPAAKKHGISFSTTTGSKTATEEALATQTAVVPFQPAQDEDRAAHDRFVKPNGKAAVVEDKHLTAYVDSKLAELRSTSATPVPTLSSGLETGKGVTSNQNGPPGDIGPGADAKSTVQEQQETRQRNSQRVKPTKSRRGPPQRGASDVARDAMVDQIMRESQVPIYDQSSSKTQNLQIEGFDADEAAAEAFRAEFLQSLEEQQNHRRRPAAPPVQQRGAPPVPTGPKLGGSRAQREKMKAIEEAKAAGKTLETMPKRR